VNQPQQLLNAGVELMLAGMGTVFVFLTLLVVATMGMSALVQRFTPVPDAADGGVSAEELAAISAAVHQFRHSSSAPSKR